MVNGNELRLKQKANFYFREKLICHVIKEPKGFVNGWFRSDLKTDDRGRLYYDFEDQRHPNQEIKLYFWDIFDIEDYEEVIK